MSRALTGERLRRIMPGDTPEELAHTLADEDAPDVEPVEPDRRALLAQMYPADQPLPDGGGANDAMVSLPGGQLGGEIRAAPAQPEPASPARQPAVTKVPEEKPGGGYSFDLARGLTGFAGGPGAIAAYDKAEQERKEAPLKLEMQRGELADKQAERSTKLKDIRDAMDPGSESSRAAQESFAAINDARAKVLADKNPALARVFAQAAASAQGKTRLQLNNAEAHHKQVMGEILKVIDADARQALAAQGQDTRARGVAAQEKVADSTIGDRQADNRLQREKFEWEKTNANKNNARVHLTGDQQKLIGEMASDLNQVRVMDQILPLAEKYASSASNIPGAGKSGILSGPIQSLKSMANPSSDSEYNGFRATVQRLFSVERKTFAGVAVTPQEMVNLAPMIPDFNKDSEKTIHDKLISAREWLKTHTDTNMSRLQYDAQGNPLDQSLLAKMLSEQAPKSTQANPAIRAAAGKSPAAPAADPAQVGRARKAAAAGNAKAAQWLKENGHAP